MVRKGGRKEDVNISSKALHALSEWLAAREYDDNRVFMGLSYLDAWRIIKKLGKRAGLNISPHTLRHSRAVQMIKDLSLIHI